MPSKQLKDQTHNRISNLFYRAAFREILDETVDSADGKFPADCAGFVVGALAFKGRIDDAITLFEKYGRHMDSPAQGLCRFTLGLGLVRVSRYDEGRRFLIYNLRQIQRMRRLKASDDIEEFYAWQGLAFFRFFQCRYRCALIAARKSWSAALRANFKFGQALAADMRAHALVNSGEISSGLQSFEDALRLARVIGNGALQQNILSSLSNHRAFHGLDGADTLANLQAIAQSIQPQDNFTLAATQTALANQLTIRGRIDESEKLLGEAARVVLVAGHSRQKTALLHKMAFNRYLMGLFEEANELLDKAELSLDRRFDLMNMLRLAGLRRKLSSCTNSSAESIRLLDEEVHALTLRTGSGIGRNIIWREKGYLSPTLPGDDPFGDLKHKTCSSENPPYADITRIIDEGLLGFLHELMPFQIGSSVICLDLIPGEMFVFDRGNVNRSDEKISAIMKSFALALAKGGRSKRDLVELIWGYQYHALRHDPLLYALVNRVRQALGKYSPWLQVTGGEYSWDSKVKIVTYEHSETLGRPVRRREATAIHSVDPVEQDLPAIDQLNHRQLVILSEIESRKYLSAQDCASINKVSKVTATRDLTQLAALALIRRLGKGRATRYAAKKNNLQ